MTNLLLLDMDGTVRRCKSDPKAFINSPLDQEIIPEAAAALERWTGNTGCVVVGCSNQPGVAARYKTIGECIDEQVETMRMAPTISSIFFSPDSDGARCFCVRPDGSVQTMTAHTFPDLHIRSFRKPACGMLIAAMHRFGASKDSTVFGGDRDEDRLAAISAGLDFLPETVWYASDPSLAQAA